MALRAVIEHPKFARLKVLLKVNKSTALGYLECLWHFCGRYTPQGNVGKYSDADIEAWLEWDGEEGALIEAFVKARWIDAHPAERLVVHDWHKHADDATRLALKRAKLHFVGDAADLVPTDPTTCPDTVGTASGLPEPGAEPVPGPEEERDKSLSGGKAPKERARFVKPTEKQVADFFREKGSSGAEAKKYWNFYESKGWKVGKNPMVDWKAAVVGWIARNCPDLESKGLEGGPEFEMRFVTDADGNQEAKKFIKGTDIPYEENL